MKTNRSFATLMIILLLVLSLTACERSLTSKRTAEPTPQGEALPLTSEPTGVIDTLYLASTQTAMAAIGQPTIEPTLQAPVETATPLPTAIILPTATSPMAIATPVPSVPNSYTLHAGEFPFCIARRFDVNPTDLLNINGLSGGNLYRSGLTLKIPQTGRTFPGNRALRAHPTTYTVQAKDTIYSIACLFGDVYPEAIAAVNGLQPPYKLMTGQTLSIP